MIISLTMTCLVVVTFAITFGLSLALMCKKDLFRFQLKFPYFFTDLGESLFSVLVIEICHWWLVVVTVANWRPPVYGEPAEVEDRNFCPG